ncbi:probable 3-methyl-2-oxobutanoate dehydrogenase chain E1-beta [Thermoplasma acidophilum]|uniref:Probable 3-methyl-2-oxobutanoate dehydrogenase chain E1-beta n=1 Tax=Thermoplasma acidophilum (strain ATCC 25905 / DSM 1728 / JCM 9062 / NBRC 15155 / AMRC-C165) TaxID=273075 RepID=Q9HIA4_THEAC|nr:alpha-ketoacid dehydrogenase subunit beta [Thermoplasma acidophilum]CAC12557.1 probable 3-methyl-2-oxobutanoate dehydrogenase chain E1-beta [Thermoplasma acidophilum]
MNMVQALNSAMDLKMSEDDSVIILGEDVGRDGGVFRVTDGLQAKYGPQRVIDTPLSELGIVGMAIGMAVNGLKPIPEIQFQDFIYTSMDQIINQMAKIRYRSGGDYTVPLVLRTPVGGGIKGGLYHSQSGEAYFAHTAGLTVVSPSNPYDAKGLLISAIESPDPVIFLEPKRLYRAQKVEVPDEKYTIPLRKANVLKQGNDVTIVTYGSMVPTVMSVASKSKYDVEVIDLRTIAPMDRDTIISSVKKTGRVVIVHEAPRTLGVGAEISAMISERAIEYLYAPIVRVTGPDTPFPYRLEEYYLPNEGRINAALDRVMSFR